MNALPEDYLRQRGLKPMGWGEVLLAIEAKLTPADREIFQRRHRNFVGYPVENTCRSFYDFAATRGLLDLLACFRFERLCHIGAVLSPLPFRGRSVLELGAGGGYLSGYLRDELEAGVAVTDWSAESLRCLKETGFKTFSDAADPALRKKRFDFILCADSLSEVNADEDNWLRDPENASNPGYVDELEQRYGFAGKLAPWKPLLPPDGSLLIFEPIGLPVFWQGVATSLRRSGWKAAVLDPDPIWGVVASLDV